MSGEFQRDAFTQHKRGLSVVRERRAVNNQPRKTVQCYACLQMTDYVNASSCCTVCGVRLKLSSSAYAGSDAEEIITGHDGFHVKPTARTVDERRHPRVPCRNVKACVSTQPGFTVVVDVLNMSRGGLCFSSNERFQLGAPASIALHYIEGGQNIFQNCRIIWVRYSMTGIDPTTYGVEFSPK